MNVEPDTPPPDVRTSAALDGGLDQPTTPSILYRSSVCVRLGLHIG